MKLIFLLALLGLAQGALACGADGKTEAQFFGKVTNVSVDNGYVAYQIQFDQGNPSTVANPACRLDFDMAERHVFIRQDVVVNGKPYFRKGQEVSGYMVYDSKTGTYIY